LIDAEYFFLPLGAVSPLFGRKNTAATAVFATLLLVTVAIVSIAYNVLALAFGTGMNMRFDDHGL
jgi:hypothetical protein